MSRRGTDLGVRLDALARAVELGRGRCDAAVLAPAEEVVANAAARRRLAPDRTVVALAGGTGSGKSTLFNALAGADLAPTGVRRPMTSRARAAIWPGGDADGSGALLDWLDVRDRHHVDGPGLAGLVLIDLPDFDSTAAEHRLEADRLTGVVDLLVWVLDPQKYADAAVHERYLRPLSTHRDVMLVVLNQVDRLDGDAARSCLRHLGVLLDADGLHGVPTLAVSATRGDGLADLGALLAARVRGQAAAVQRVHADVDRAVAGLAPLCAAPAASQRGRSRTDDQLTRALGEAAGVGVVADAAGRAYRLRATSRIGWAPTRWLARARVNPLRRLHLGPGTSGPTSFVPAGVQQAQVSIALRELVAERAADLPPPWRRSTAALIDERRQQLPADLDRAVRAADLAPLREPRWWRPVRAVQLALLLVAVVGAVWLGVLAALSYLRLPDATLHIGRAPVPTVLLLGGLLLGLLLSVVSRPFVRVGARRTAARARRSLDAGIRTVAEQTVLAPLTAELQSAADFCAALAAAGR